MAKYQYRADVVAQKIVDIVSSYAAGYRGNDTGAAGLLLEGDEQPQLRMSDFMHAQQPHVGGYLVTVGNQPERYMSAEEFGATFAPIEEKRPAKSKTPES